MTRVVVFAYHNIGVCGLKKLIAHKAEILRVITHEDRTDENIFFDSVAACAVQHKIPCVTPAEPNSAEMFAELLDLRPDFLFSFYYRQMLSADVLTCATRGAYNLHGSLLPKYRGRAPINWAVIEGETETGVTLHRMDAKPDHGPIVDQERVPILIDDTAKQVSDKLTLACGILLDRALPALFAGTASETPQDLSQSSYFGARTPADGRIDWRWPALKVHNLVRGTTHPYPGAFSSLERAVSTCGGRPFSTSAKPSPSPRGFRRRGSIRNVGGSLRPAVMAES